MVWKMPVLALLLAVIPVAVPAYSMEANVFVYDDAVVDVIDVEEFEKTGDVTFVDGIGETSMTAPGPAPDPYPQIRFLGPCFEQLGGTDTGMDGISFNTRGNHEYWKKNERVFVVWKIRIPSASQRTAADFEGDLTLSMWVDWDQNAIWDRNELVVRKTVNIGHYLPAGRDDIYLNYLTSFRVPDIAHPASMTLGSGKDHSKELSYLWVRGSLSYDNSAVSPDGDQLYGDSEDYRVPYSQSSNKKKTDGDSD